MNQVSRPMQIALVAVLVFAAAWFLVLRPSEPGVEPVAATPASGAGGAQAQTALGKTIETARNGAAGADAAIREREQQTGEDAPDGTSPGAEAADDAAEQAAETKAKAKQKRQERAAARRRAADERATRDIEAMQKDMKAGHAIVVLVWAPDRVEDKLMKQRIVKQIDTRDGKVDTYLVRASDVGSYSGLFGDLELGQTPATVVITPKGQAKVLGGLTSVVRIDRLTSSALLVGQGA